VLLCCTAIAATAWSTSASASIVHPYLSSFGSFSEVKGVATDSAGDVYVYDSGAATIFKFDASGNPVDFTSTGANEITGVAGAGFAEGQIAIDNSNGPAKGDIYVAHASSSGVLVYNAAGESLPELQEPAGKPWGEACGVAVDSQGNVYVGLYPSDVDKFKPSANPVTRADYSSSIEGVHEACNVAADDAGNIFADTWSEGPITRFEPSQFGSSSPTGSLVAAAGSSLAIDPVNQEVYADELDQIEQFGPHGEPFDTVVSRFAHSGAGAISESTGIAIGPVNHDVYASNGKGQINVYGPAASLLEATTGTASELTATGARLSGGVNPEGSAVTECFFEYGESNSYGKTIPCAESPAQLGSGSQPISVHANLAGLEVGPIYHFRLVAVDANGTSEGLDRSFSVSAPVIEAGYATDITSTSATLQGDIDPLSNDTSYHFEYGFDTDYGSSTPASDVGASTTSQPALAHLQDLTADTTYHYRLVATSNAGTAFGADFTFTTESVGGPLTLLDGRQWEMVSPPVKHGAGILADSRNEGGLVQASTSGDAIAYLARSPIEVEPEGNAAPETSQILARRTADGTWSNKTMTTRSEESHRLPAGNGNEYKMFTADLSSAIIQPYGTTPLAPNATDERAPYLRNEAACAASSTNCFTPFLTRENTLASAKWDVEPESVLMTEEFLEATPDLKHSILQSRDVKLIEGAANAGLYEWSEGQLEFVSVNEAGEPVSGALGSFGGYDKRNAISSDGSRVFWCEKQCGNDSEGDVGPLFMRDTVTEETIRIDPAGDVYRNFAGATEDGSRVFFMTEASGEFQRKLSECAIVQTAGKLSCEPVEVAPELQGTVLGINPDGSIVYFVSKAALTGNAQAGGNNLYVSHLEGGKWESRLVATLADGSADRTDWGTEESELRKMTARVSPNGRYLTFMSDRSLTGYDNHDAVSGEADEEVFLYDDQTGKLICASCNRSGARPEGLHFEGLTKEPLIDTHGALQGNWVAADIPAWDPINSFEPIHEPRFLSDEGRLFFNSTDALVPQDTNGVADVYEYEPEGLGSCTEAGGCVALISSGTSGEESAFIEASESGDDVFFVSTARLSTQDVDTDYDVYDAHVCTSAAPCVQTSAPPPPCSNGEACKAAPTPQPPIFGAPASATFTGAGNPAPPATAPAKAKPPTRAQQLAKALKACRKDKSKSKRSSCEKQARKKYGAKAKAKPKAKAKSHKANSGKSKAHKGGK
jgi:WD40-like Beta Propeller Repeat